MEKAMIDGSIKRTPSRQTIIAATAILKSLGHAGFDQLLLEFSIPAEAGQGSGLKARAVPLAAYAIENPGTTTAEGVPIASAIVERAVQLFRSTGAIQNVTEAERQTFQSAAEGDGLHPVSPKQDGGELVLGGQDEDNGWKAASITFSGPDVTKLSEAAASHQAKPGAPSPKGVFVVHGHDKASLYAVARFLEKLGLTTIILDEQPNQGRTIIEKFEASASQVGFAVVLLTPDDVGGAVSAPQNSLRARQNVIFELGYFVGKLGRGRACLLRKGEVEIPSDLYGVIYTDMDANDGWKLKLMKELHAAKLEFETDRIWT